VSVWSNHRVMEWLRTIDLSEYAPNLRGSGVHGGIMVSFISRRQLALCICATVTNYHLFVYFFLWYFNMRIEIIEIVAWTKRKVWNCAKLIIQNVGSMADDQRWASILLTLCSAPCDFSAIFVSAYDIHLSRLDIIIARTGDRSSVLEHSKRTSWPHNQSPTFILSL